MRKKIRIDLTIGLVALMLFDVLILLLLFVDVRPIGPESSLVGLATINAFFRDLIGEHLEWYQITEYLGYGVLGVAAIFALVSLIQWIRRRSLRAVDRDLFYLMILYVVLGCTYLLFEKVIINYRPVVLEEGLEASFPSSHTMLALTVMGTCAFQLKRRIPVQFLGLLAALLCIAFMLAVEGGRFYSGVHWFTDILGGTFISLAFIFIYVGAVRNKEWKDFEPPRKRR